MLVSPNALLWICQKPNTANWVGVSLSSFSWPRVGFWLFLHKKGDCFSHRWESRQNIHVKPDCVVSKYHSSSSFMPLISRITLNTWHSWVHTLKPFKNVKNSFCSSCPVMFNIVMVSLFFLIADFKKFQKSLLPWLWRWWWWHANEDYCVIPMWLKWSYEHHHPWLQPDERAAGWREAPRVVPRWLQNKGL